MTKKITPVIIGKHDTEEKEYIKSVEAKTTSFKTLFDYLNTFVSIEEPESFEGRILDEFYSRCYDKYHEAFPTLSLPKILELHNCHPHKVDALIHSFESTKIEWDFTRNEPKHESPDFNIYATTESEIKLFNYLNRLIEAQELIKDNGVNFYPAPFIQAFPNALIFDFTTNSVKPNISFIKNQIS